MAEQRFHVGTNDCSMVTSPTGEEAMSLPTSPTTRDRLVQRLQEDLIGPRDVVERLVPRPSDVYLTGILWPKNTALAPEEDERLAAGSDGQEGSDDAEDQSQAKSFPMRRTSTAGVSFAAASSSQSTPTVSAHIRFGLYEQHEIDGRKLWVRKPVSHTITGIGLESGNQDIPVPVDGLSGLRLNVHAVRFADGMLATITLVNGSTPEVPGRAAIERCTAFQVELSIVPEQNTKLISRPSRRAPVDEDDWSSALLYRNAKEYAVGHTCSADWVEVPASPEQAALVKITWIPASVVHAVSPEGDEVFRDLKAGALDPLSAEWISHAFKPDLLTGLRRLPSAYESWIEKQEKLIPSLPEEFASIAVKHMQEAKLISARMQAGIRFLETSDPALEAFQLANLAMNTQRNWAGLGNLKWRPFQLAFFLLTLESSAISDHPDRSVMDLLWFPTGGGKTEAYLGLIAFVAFHRRLSRPNPDDGSGVAVLMRYTLRLLTTQQFIRAAAMICACEAIRREKIPIVTGKRLGKEQFSIGLWVGDGATPNSRQSAFESWRDSSKASAKQLVHCPCCQTPLTHVQNAATDCVTVLCNNQTCLLNGERLPVWTVDEDVYAYRPTLLIGTVDKFAQIVRKQDTAALFSVNGTAQPQLIVQDELHLISGPLGTVTGLYETAIDLILSAQGSKPKIIGSTATIRRASEQVSALFDRTTCQFPTPGLDADNSGFTVVDRNLPGRLYLGATTAGRSAKFTLQAVAASLLQTASAETDPAAKDAYWTLVTYFNSLRELGGALVLMQDDVHDQIQLLATARQEQARKLESVQELTSRESQAKIREMLETLAHPAGHDEAVDTVLATNMVSVGVDISRLGLMIVNGQPKTMAEYIQATSRVGRSVVPGVVVPVLNNAKPRDRSHFESFKTWHNTIYREVEATSVTPFASRARDRALHAVLVAAVRHLVPSRIGNPVLDDTSIAAAEALIDKIAARANRVDPLEMDVKGELTEKLKRWIRRAPQEYWNHHRASTSLLQAAEQAAALRAAGRSPGQAWPTLNTMRGVEPSTNYRLVEGLRKNNGQQ
jgi:hypothetical protein